LTVHENFPRIPPSDFALVDTDDDGKPEKVPIKRPKDLKKTYFPKGGATEIFTLTPHEPTTRFDPANPAGSSDGSSTTGGSTTSSFVQTSPMSLLQQEDSNSTNATLAKLDLELEESMSDGTLNKDFFISNQTLASIEEQGASDSDIAELDDTEPDEKNDIEDNEEPTQA
jgi:hypothetical protein